ncbi:hypothetical protein AB0L05_33480 [Nonomuraea pusilla]|uniref:hypothetical protein n=1 Tax=Nonomuraea pusilla TaxID=46177 RepID=UPI003333BAF4
MVQTGVAALAAALSLGGLPQGTLFMESHPPARAWETYEVTESARLPLQLNPCMRKTRWDAGRLTGRAVLYTAENEMRYEQLVVYRDVRHARLAMRGLRAELRRCADVGKGHDRYRYFRKPLRVGDEGLRAGGRFFESGEQAVAVRRGAALYLVGESAYPSRSLPLGSFRRLVDQAERMTVKICELPRSAC